MCIFYIFLIYILNLFFSHVLILLSFEHLKQKIEENIEKMNQLKHIIEYYLKHIKIVKGNTDIYEKNQKIII